MAFRFPTTGTYTFHTATGTGVDDFLWTSPISTQATSIQDAATSGNPTERDWNWENSDTLSTNVGPESGSGGDPEGYVYTEASSPAAANDVFIMELDQNLDASANSIVISYKWCYRGNSASPLVESVFKAGTAGSWTNGGTTTYGNITSWLTGVTAVWNDATTDFSGLVSDPNTRVGVRVTFPSAGTIWHNDCGIDNFLCVGTALFERVQEGYRWRNDDGNETAATWLAAQDTTATTIATGNNRRLRILTDYTGGDPDAEAATLEYKEEGDNTSEWRPVPLTA